MRGEICKNHFAVEDLISYPNGRIFLKRDALPLSSIDKQQEQGLTKIMMNSRSERITKSPESSDCTSCREKRIDLENLLSKSCIEKQKHQNIVHSMQMTIDDLKGKLKKYQNQSNYLRKTNNKLLETISKSIETNENQNKITRLLEVFNLFRSNSLPHFKNIFYYFHDCCSVVDYSLLKRMNYCTSFVLG